MSSLPTSSLISVSVSLTPAGAQAQNLSTLLILGSTDIIDVAERWREYASLAEVAASFTSTDPEYKSAALWFQQSPQPTTLRIGRWAKTATKGKLNGAPLTTAQQALAIFTAVTSGGFTYTKDGGAPTNVTGINLSAATNLNGVAALITAALTGATMTWNAAMARFQLVSSTTGATSSISFLTAPGSGTNLAPLLFMQAADSGAHQVGGIALETADAAVTIFDRDWGQSWYAVMIPEAVNSEHLAVAALVEGLDNKHLYGVTTQEAGALVAATTSDIAYQLAQLGYNRTIVQYSSTSAQAVASLFGRLLTVDYTANASVITLAYKQQPGIVAEGLNTVQAASLRSKNCNAFMTFNNQTAIVLHGVASSGNFIDVVTSTDWLAITLQQQLYNLLYTSTTKVPQTDAGMTLLQTTAEAVCAQGVVNGMLAPGVWNSNGFGILKQGDFMPKGFYVHIAPIGTQSPVDRAARRSPPIQIAAKLAGAVHEISVAVTVNQ